MDILEELFFGTLQPNLPSYVNDTQYGKAVTTVNSVETELLQTLAGVEKNHFLDMVNAYGEMLGITAKESFISGFRMGARFMLDSLGLKQPES